MFPYLWCTQSNKYSFRFWENFQHCFLFRLQDQLYIRLRHPWPGDAHSVDLYVPNGVRGPRDDFRLLLLQRVPNSQEVCYNSPQEMHSESICGLKFEFESHNESLNFLQWKGWVFQNVFHEFFYVIFRIVFVTFQVIFLPKIPHFWWTFWRQVAPWPDALPLTVLDIFSWKSGFSES